jgi:AraC-like DNA-binding protein
MKLYIKYDINIACRAILQEQLEKMDIAYDIIGFSEVVIKNNLTDEEHNKLNSLLKKYGIEILDDRISNLVQKTKDMIMEIVYMDEKLPASKISAYLASKLNYSYGYIADLFSAVTFSSIENYFIMQKIERAKQLISQDDLTLTQISYKLNYSSLAHLSSQFKKTTGITPSAFQRILKKRREQ